jgi:hypothetical protein
MLIKMKGKQCKEAMTITHQSGLVLDEVRCTREQGHQGMCVNGKVAWLPMKHDTQARIEQEGLK